MSNTQWVKADVAGEQIKHIPITTGLLRGTHTLWSRIMDGEQIYTIRPDGETPGPNDGGYRSAKTALKVKGMLTGIDAR